jgi:hypothetical protein
LTCRVATRQFGSSLVDKLLSPNKFLQIRGFMTLTKEIDHTTKEKKVPYVLGIAAATLTYGVSLLEPRIHGPKIWIIFICAGFAVWISALKLRKILHGTGWVFPRTSTFLLWAVGIEIWLHVWFSH